jgi:hypothetical protein
MATESTEPNVKLIAKIAVISIATLVIVRIGLVSYFHYWEDKLKADRNALEKSADLDAVKANEKSLFASPVPIDKAIAQVEKDPTRAGSGVAPQHPDSGMDDLRAVTDCWSKLPCDGGALLAEQQAMNAPAQDAGSGDAATDAGKAPKPRR